MRTLCGKRVAGGAVLDILLPREGDWLHGFVSVNNGTALPYRMNPVADRNEAQNAIGNCD